MNEYNSYYSHRDNGGIHFELTTQEYGTKLEVYAQYFGYPTVTSSLDGLSKKDLKEIGLMFLKHADSVDK